MTTPLVPSAAYRHTNLVARDWRRLARFYERVFGCTPVPPERDLSGDWLERGTGVADARLWGVHLRLPGCGDAGPTLELFQYSEVLAAQGTAVPNRVGYGHIAFAVDDVHAAVDAVLREGGSRAGDVVTHEVPGAGDVCFAYVRDPEGNLVEIQRWS